MKNLKRQVGKDLERITGIKRGSGGGIGLKDKRPDLYGGTTGHGPADVPLFGDNDMVVNALEMEKAILKGDLQDIGERIKRAQLKAVELQTRNDLIGKALDFMRKKSGGPKAAKK